MFPISDVTATPPTQVINLGDLFPLIERFGIPLFMLVAFVFLLYRRVIVLGSDADHKEKILEAEVAYRERLRDEERDARVLAERQLAAHNELIRDMTDALKDVEKEVIRATRDH